MFTNIVRHFNISKAFWSAETSLLAKLRKKTGYTFSNCKKALEMHNNDLEKAEDWLHKQAQAMGWAKATKLAGRATTQGLIAIKYDKSHAAMVEINCETDFVARNEKFIAMMEEAASACFKFSHTSVQAQGLLTKMCLDSEQLGAVHGPQGKTLAESLVLMIGNVGENAVLRRAECWKAAPGLHLAAYTHPISFAQNSDFATGKYGGLLAYQCENFNDNINLIGKQICQHVVGMNPKKVGTEEDEPHKDADEEICLIHQEFITDSSLSVSEVLKENKISVVDFTRFECGEDLNLLKEHAQPLENVQTCQ